MSSKTRHSALRWVHVPSAAGLAPGSGAPLTPEKLLHLRKVLRLEWESELRATDGKGRVFEARLERGGESGRVRIERLVSESSSPPPVQLVICLPKNVTMDWVVEKAVECGATSILPVVSSRSVVKPNESDLGKYVRRWQSIIDGAIEQSERAWSSEIRPPCSWEEWLRAPAPEGRSFAFISEERGTADLRATWIALQAAGLEAVRVLIGPEGGLSPAEREALAGFEALTLGDAVLRVETAVVAALTLVRVSRSCARPNS